jgi:hypothetical protein
VSQSCVENVITVKLEQQSGVQLRTDVPVPVVTAVEVFVTDDLLILAADEPAVLGDAVVFSFCGQKTFLKM